MGATGESVRRVTDRGFNPAWSPDGRHLVVSSESVTLNPEGRAGTRARLSIIDVSTGERKDVGDFDAVQPSWSPNGKRIAYWSIETPEGQRTGQRDLWTVNVDGNNRVAVTNDNPVDWSPAWSPEGKYLYF